jgi:Protein of unknown function (DUF1761)
MKEIDLVTVFFASALYMIMYLVWYSKILFGKIYKRLTINNKKKPLYYYFLIFLCMLIITYGLAVLEVLLGVTSFQDGIFLGFIIWFAFVCTHDLFLVLSFKRNIKLFLIDNFLYLIALMVICVILAG